MSKRNKGEIPVPKHITDSIDKQKLKVKIIKDTVKDLQTNPKYKEYFSDYTPESIEEFINRYAQRKSDFVIYGPDHQIEKDRKLNQYTKEAKEYFPMIQQDKLLRLQYEWNEGNMALDGIECNFDFYPLYHDIFNCKFISDVTKEDVDIMSDYIRTNKDPDYMLSYHASNYVNHAVYWNAENDRDYEYNRIPPFHFYRMSITLEKPLSKESLIRAKKEEDYIKKHHEEMRRSNPEMFERREPDDARPRFYGTHEFKRKFIVKFEDQKLLNNYDAWYRAIIENEDMVDKINLAVWHLQETGEHHPVQAHDDWRTSIIEAAEKSKKEKTAQALYLVYDEYLQCLKNHTPFMPMTEVQKSYGEIWPKYKENLLHGREVCGEPRDCNF